MKMILVKIVLHAIIGKCSTMLVALDSILSTNKNQRIVTITIICSWPLLSVPDIFNLIKI